MRVICCLSRHVPVCFDAQATVSGWRQTLKTFASWDKDTVFVPDMDRFVGKKALHSPGALRRHRGAGPEDAQSRRAAVEAADLYEIPEKYKNVGYFCLGLFHWTGDYQVVREWQGK